MPSGDGDRHGYRRDRSGSRSPEYRRKGYYKDDSRGRGRSPQTFRRRSSSRDNRERNWGSQRDRDHVRRKRERSRSNSASHRRDSSNHNDKKGKIDSENLKRGNIVYSTVVEPKFRTNTVTSISAKISTIAVIEQPNEVVDDSFSRLLQVNEKKEEELLRQVEASLPDDSDGDDDFEDQKRKAEENEQKLAEERRKRLNDIKDKYSEVKASAAEVGLQSPRRSRPHEVGIQTSMLSKEGPGMAEDESIFAEVGLASQNNDEGEQLAMERRAVAAEDNKTGFDMFSDSPSGIEALAAKAKGPAVGKRATREALLEGENAHLMGNWDDGEGYYKATIGEVVADRYQVMGIVGKGVFSTVLKCVDRKLSASLPPLLPQDGNHHSINHIVVAVKLIRNNDTMRKAAEKERSILSLMKDNKRFCVRLLDCAEYRHHVAFVFEYQQMNLREAVKKFGKDVGINVSAVRIYGRQLFVALQYLASLKIVHADIKLDNILVSEDLKTVKLCDFGSAFFESDSDNDPTPYLVSRFYRAPEIILGLPYDRHIDLWSICVCLYELFTGHVMFPGRTNNEMLRLMMAVKGRFPNRMLKSHIRSYETLGLEPHFSSIDWKFRQYEQDSVSGKLILRNVEITHPTRELASLLRQSKAGSDDLRQVLQLCDLLEQGLALEPAKRLKVNDGLRHPFFALSTATSQGSHPHHSQVSSWSRNSSRQIVPEVIRQPVNG